MASGSLSLHLSDLAGDPVRNFVIDFSRFKGGPGAGGESLEVSVAGPKGALTISGVTCREGPGTMYRVRALVDHYRPYTFVQQIRADRINTASDDVEAWVKAGDVTDISAPAFADLPPKARALLDQAAMIEEKAEDRDLVGLKGEELYRALGPLRKACLLNLVAKASHKPTTDGCITDFGGVMVCRQDRFFARVAAGLPERLRKSPLFKSAPESLHQPLPGFEMAEGSFKSRDAHANIQITFMRDTATGGLGADIDIDESSGIKHGLEVIKNATLKSRTNPYLIREFLLSADPIERSLDPGYRFRF